MGLFTQAFSLLADPPGDLLYHLVLVFSISGALQAAFIHWRISAFPQARRTVIGLTVLMLPQVILFSSGDVTPYRITLSRASSGASATVEGAFDGTIEVSHDDAT